MRIAILVIVSFILGFITHKHLLRYNIGIVSTTDENSTTQEETKEIAGKDIDVKYQDNRFNPSEVTIEIGRYLSITNNSESLMWLTSDNSKFNTERGYGKSEQVRVRLNKEISFQVSNKLNLNTKPLQVIVKK